VKNFKGRDILEDARTGKSIPLQASTNPYGCRRLKLPEFLNSRHMKVGRLLALCTDDLYFPGDTPSTHFG